MRYLLGALFLLFLMDSCSKFENGPAISFRSKENRLIGEWKLIKWTENGQDVTAMRTDSLDVVYRFEENRTLRINLGDSKLQEGTWSLEETNVIMDLQMVSEIGNYIEKDTLMLSRLTKKEMEVYFDDQLQTKLYFEAQ
ncbi:MAG: hypothetical protein RLY35_2156 [Bacteroidota bacterium]